MPTRPPPPFPAHPEEPTASAAALIEPQEEADVLEVARPKPCRVLVTGASGFVGRHLLPRLLSRQHRIRALYRLDPDDVRLAIPNVEWRRADVADPASLSGVAENCDAVVHLAAITRETAGQTFERVNVAGTRNLLAEFERSGAGRFILVSALGAHEAAGDYFRSRHLAEEAVVRLGAGFIVLRPSAIYGPADHLTTAVARVLRTFPVFPMPGTGSFHLQPVAIEDLTDAICQVIERTGLERRVFDLIGPETLSFRTVVRTVARVLGLRRPILPLPARPAHAVEWLASRWDLPAALLPDQLDLLRLAGLAGMRGGEAPGRRGDALVSVFHLRPLPFGDALADYL